MMRLREFIKSTLVDVIEGVREAQQDVAGKGAAVNPGGFRGQPLFLSRLPPPPLPPRPRRCRSQATLLVFALSDTDYVPDRTPKQKNRYHEQESHARRWWLALQKPYAADGQPEGTQ